MKWFKKLSLTLIILLLCMIEKGLETSVTCPKTQGEKGTLAGVLQCGKKASATLDKECKAGVTKEMLDDAFKTCANPGIECLNKNELTKWLTPEVETCALKDGVGANMHNIKNLCDPQKKKKVESCAMQKLNEHKKDVSKLSKCIPFGQVLCDRTIACVVDVVEKHRKKSGKK